MKDRAEKNMYLEKPVIEQGDNRVFNGDNPDEAKAFWDMIKKDEKNREEANKSFIDNLTSDLYELNRLIVEEMKTKSDAVRIRELVNARLYILEETREDDEFVGKWDCAIKKAKFILDQIDIKFEYLPDDMTNPKESDYPYLTKKISHGEQVFLYKELQKNGFIKCDFKDFCFAIGGTYTQNFKKIKWRKSLQTLRMLLEKLRDVNIGVKETMRRADLFFTRENGQPLKMPNRKRNEYSNDESIMNNIITAYQNATT